MTGKDLKHLGAKSREGRPSAWLTEKPVGEGLRKAYQSVTEEPIPEKMQKLIDEMKRRERRGSD